MGNENPVAYSGGTISTLLEKLHPDYRRGLDRAIIERDPPSLADVFARFHVASKGISRSAFYRYAARLRASAALIESAELAIPEGRDPVDALTKLLDSEFLRCLTARAPVPPPADDGSDVRVADEDDRSDPYALDDSAINRLNRIVHMRQRLAFSRLLSERAATLREDAEFRRNNTQTREIAAALRAYASAALDKTERMLGTRPTAPVSHTVDKEFDPKGGQ
jgi:hypothetical protein